MDAAKRRDQGPVSEIDAGTRRAASAVQAMDEVAQGLTVDPDAMQANMDATEGAVLADLRRR